jgi:hypothetical protein
MMRPRLASLALVASCVSGFLLAPASSLGAARGAGAPASSAGGAAERTWSVTLSPAPGDLALVEIGFRRTVRGGISSRSLHIGVTSPFGDDYVAAAVPRLRTPGGARALVLLVNRPSPLLDPVGVRLRLGASRALGAPSVLRLTNPFTRPVGGPTPALCGLPLRGSALGGSDLRTLGSYGAALSGFGAASAVAQAYDVACGLPHAGSFKQALGGRCSSATVPPGTLCCPANAICAPAPPPAPAPPAPVPPGCMPCDPPPGYACPLAPAADVCVAPVSAGARPAPAGAH